MTSQANMLRIKLRKNKAKERLEGSERKRVAKVTITVIIINIY